MYVTDDLKSSARRVHEVLMPLGVTTTVREMPHTTGTAADAAAAIGCSLGQIVKSLVFRGKSSGTPFLILAAGPNRVDEEAIGRLVHEPLEKAMPEFVGEKTGFAIGGVAPVGLVAPAST